MSKPDDKLGHEISEASKSTVEIEGKKRQEFKEGVIRKLLRERTKRKRLKADTIKEILKEIKEMCIYSKTEITDLELKKIKEFLENQDFDFVRDIKGIAPFILNKKFIFNMLQIPLDKILETPNKMSLKILFKRLMSQLDVDHSWTELYLSSWKNDEIASEFNISKVLSELFKANKTLTELHITENMSAGQAELACFKWLKENKTVKTLELCGVNSQESYHASKKMDENYKVAQAISEMLKKNKVLTNLYIYQRADDINDVWSPEDSDKFGEIIIKGLEENQTLKDLAIHTNSFGRQTAQRIGLVLEKHRALTSLSIDTNLMEDIGEIAEALKKNTTLTKLDAHYNDLAADSFKAMAKVLEVNRTLTELSIYNVADFYTDDVKGKFEDPIDGVEALAKALAMNKTLTTLEYNNDNCIEVIYENNPAKLQKLKELDEAIVGYCERNRNIKDRVEKYWIETVVTLNTFKVTHGTAEWSKKTAIFPLLLGILAFTGLQHNSDVKENADNAQNKALLSAHAPMLASPIVVAKTGQRSITFAERFVRSKFFSHLLQDKTQPKQDSMLANNNRRPASAAASAAAVDGLSIHQAAAGAPAVLLSTSLKGNNRKRKQPAEETPAPTGGVAAAAAALASVPIRQTVTTALVSVRPAAAAAAGRPAAAAANTMDDDAPDSDGVTTQSYTI